MGQLRDVTLNDAALMQEIVESLIAELPAEVEAIRRTLECQDSRRCAALAHALKGACGNVGAVALAEIMRDLQTLAEQNRLADCALLVERAPGEIAQLRDEMALLARR